MNSDLESLITECIRTLPTALTSATGASLRPENVALSMLMDCARTGSVSTLPYVLPGKGVVHWVSFGGDSRGLLEYSEDLRSWIHPGYGTHGDIEFARAVSQGRLGKLVQSVSPSGYLRWTSGANSLSSILHILNQMHGVLSSMPEMAPTSPPSVHVLRFRFVSALRCGEWGEAEQIINDIDRWNLEQAHKTMQMRMRLLGESRDHAALLDMVERHGLWALTHPTRVAEAIVEAVIHEVLEPMESTLTPEVTCENLRPWFAKLLTVLPRVAPHGSRDLLLAYFACLDGDGVTALDLTRHLPDRMAEFVRARFQPLPTSGDSKSTAEPTSALNSGTFDEVNSDHRNPGQAYWNLLKTLVRQGSMVALESHLSELDSRVDEDPRLLYAAPDVLMDLISDPTVDIHSTSWNALQEVLTALVDVIFSIPGFPSGEYLDLYLSVAEALVYVRGSSASEEDAHLLHGLLAAIANLSALAVPDCTKLLRTWWQLRPILPRLDWLLAVLDSLAPLHPHPGEMVDLWAQAVELAKRKQIVLSPTQLRLWQRVSGLLELDASSVAQDLASLHPMVHENQFDTLGNAKWQKIAIVSLQETSAREAARELQIRTQAEVIVVTSLVQDGLTKSAKTADVILLVWAACSHAVYRAFDECRSRVAYVQGTGTSSIVAAAERWAEKKSAEKLL